MSDPTEQPAPVVAERHRELAAAISRDPELHYLHLTEDAIAQILARAFPLQVPTTDRPTVPGWYWLKKQEADWIPVMVSKEVEADGEYLYVEDIADFLGLVSSMDEACEWLRIPTPDELAGKGAA